MAGEENPTEEPDVTQFVTVPGTVTYSQSQFSPLGLLSLAGEHHDVRGRDLPAMSLRFWDIFAVVYVLSGTGTYQSAGGHRFGCRPGL